MEDKIICPLCGKEMTERSSVCDFGYPKSYLYKCDCDKYISVLKKVYKNAITFQYTDKNNLLYNQVHYKKEQEKEPKKYIVRVIIYNVFLKKYEEKIYIIKTNNIYEEIGIAYDKTNVVRITYESWCIEKENGINKAGTPILDCSNDIEEFHRF